MPAPAPSTPHRSCDPFFTPEVILRGLYAKERVERRAVRIMAITPGSRDDLPAVLAEISAKYAARIAEHKRVWCLDGGPVSEADAAILRGPEWRDAA